MGKDQMGYYKGWIQFQSNKIAEISLFGKIKRGLTNDKPTIETITRSPETADATMFSQYIPLHGRDT